MEPIPESWEAFDELDPLADQLLLARLIDSGRRVREIVPQCVGLSVATTALGVTFTLVASAREIAVLDAMQYLQDGPCVETVKGSHAQQFDRADFLGEQEWQLFAAATAAPGILSTLTLPVLVDHLVIGSINLYAATAGAFVGLHEPVAAIFDAWAPGAVSNADLAFDTRLAAVRAPEELRAAARVETAVGIIAATLDIDLEQAARALREAAAYAGVNELRVAEALIRALHGGQGLDVGGTAS